MPSNLQFGKVANRDTICKGVTIFLCREHVFLVSNRDTILKKHDTIFNFLGTF